MVRHLACVGCSGIQYTLLSPTLPTAICVVPADRRGDGDRRVGARRCGVADRRVLSCVCRCFGSVGQTRQHRRLRLTCRGKGVEHRVHPCPRRGLRRRFGRGRTRDPVADGDGDGVARCAGDQPGSGGVLIARVFESAIGDQHDAAEIGLHRGRVRRAADRIRCSTGRRSVRHRNRRTPTARPAGSGARRSGAREPARRRNFRRTGQRAQPSRHTAYTSPPRRS